MHVHPVHYEVDVPIQFSRLQLAIRVIAFVALGALGISFGGVFLFAYLALPAYAASRIAAVGAEGYAANDGPRVLRALRWFAALSAWAGLIAEQLPGSDPGAVRIVIDERPRASARSVLWRVVTGIPSALVLMALGWIGVFVWLWAAISILLSERIGPRALAYLEGLQRWSVRLLAYQACLVDEYPPFSFSDTEPRVPQARAIERADDR